MSVVSDLFQQSQLAEGSYADFSNTNITTEKALTNAGFSATQATTFVTKWEVKSHIPNTPNGFSATVFKNIDPGSADFGKFQFVVRGTEGSPFTATGSVDWFSADLGDIGDDGLARTKGTGVELFSSLS